MPPDRRRRVGRWSSGEELPRRTGEPDVLLDVPDLHVGSIRLAVDGLDVDLSLRARLASLLQLDAGVHVRLNAVELDIEDVHAEALLKVRLERLVEILDRALNTIDRNPQILESVTESAQAALHDADRAAQHMTGSTRQLGSIVDRLGQQVGSISAQAQWTGEGLHAKETTEGRGAPGQAGGAGQAAAGAVQAAGGAGQAAGQGQQAARQGQPPGPGERAPGRPEEGRPGPGQAGQPRTQQGQPGQRQAEQRQPGQPQAAGGQAQGRGDQGQAGQPQAGQPQAGQGQAGQARGAQPEQGQPGEGWPMPTPADLAGHAGEVLRQAGRSVWDAIRSGIEHRGPQSKG